MNTAKLYIYHYNINDKCIEETIETVKETEKQYSIMDNTGSIPFLYKSKLLKTEIGTIANAIGGYTCVLLEQDGLKARQIFLNYVKTQYENHKAETERYKSYIDSLQ